VRGEVLAFEGGGSTDADGDPLTYAWDFGDGTTATGPSVTHTYAALGVYTVSLVVSDPSEASVPATLAVSVDNRAPVASAGGPYSGLHGAAIAFDATASSDADGDALTYAWTFGDGASGSGPAPAHAYAADGTYEVTVVVSDGVDSVTASTTAVVSNAVPVARAGGPYTGFKNAPFVLDGTASTDGNGDSLTYRWDFGDGTTGTGPTPSHTYDMPPGYYAYVYYARLVVNDGTSDSAPVTTTVQVKDHLPVAHAGGAYTAYRSQPVTLDGSASSDEDGDPLTYTWDFGDGTTGTGVNPTHAYTTFGTFWVRLVVNDGYMDSWEATTSVSVVDRAPIAEAGGPYAGVRGTAIAFDGSSSADPDGNPLTFSWDFGDGTTGTGAQPTHVYTTMGTFLARLVVNDGARDSVADTAWVAISNRVPTAHPAGPYTGTRVQAVSFDGSLSSDPDGDPLTYEWTFGDGATGTGMAPTHTYAGLGTFTVTLRVRDGMDVSAPVATTVAISNVAPVANAGPDRTVRRRTTVTLDGTASSDPDGTIAAYSWRRVSGPSVTLQNANTAQPRFTAPNVSSTQVLVFELQVTDSNAATAVDQVRITVTR
jgi:PKD repeat protein